MNNSKLINKAFNELKGDIKIGDIIAHRSHRLAHKLVDIVGNIAVCSLPDGTINKWSVDEIANVNKVKNRAIELAIFSNREN